jgi:murein L,D-transpeptidase YafK
MIDQPQRGKNNMVYRRHMCLWRHILIPSFVLSAIVLALLTSRPGHAGTQPVGLWLAVDTHELTLSIMQGDSPLKVYSNIAIGSNGATSQRKLLDKKTPLGDFRINAIKTSSRFRLFLSIDYPTMEDAQKAFDEERISEDEYSALSQALLKGMPPPQNTSLGGHLGIHGVGLGNVEVHNRFNWTNGCIALTNDQVDELAGWVNVGTKVRIR